jgi:hypothetical protein
MTSARLIIGSGFHKCRMQQRESKSDDSVCEQTLRSSGVLAKTFATVKKFGD